MDQSDLSQKMFGVLAYQGLPMEKAAILMAIAPLPGGITSTTPSTVKTVLEKRALRVKSFSGCYCSPNRHVGAPTGVRLY